MDSIQVTNYEINTGLGLRMALVTDMHSMPYDDLLMLLQKEEPDAILLSGDTLERHEEGKSEWSFLSMEEWQFLPEMKGPMVSLMRVLDRLVEHKGIEAEEEEDLGLAFLRDISKLAPVFMSVGNHEWYFTAEDESFFADHNITVLDNTDVQVTIKGKKLRIGGLSTRYDLDWLEEYAQKEGTKILLCHHPEHYKYKIKDRKTDTFDLVLSGHYHGGQWRIGNVGVYVPRIGLMIPKVKGKFGKHIISAGVSNTTRFPRLGNPRELVMINI